MKRMTLPLLSFSQIRVIVLEHRGHNPVKLFSRSKDSQGAVTFYSFEECCAVILHFVKGIPFDGIL